MEDEDEDTSALFRLDATTDDVLVVVIWDDDEGRELLDDTDDPLVVDEAVWLLVG